MDLDPDFVKALTGRYEFERELGHGGMAIVYLARDLKHHRHVALKVLRPELAASLGPERFLREIEIVAPFVHPNILTLHVADSAAGHLFYVMPYVSGLTLGQRLKREVQLPIDDALAITRQIAAALDYAHARGVIHRDIKPDNILLLDGHVYVADFGLARAVSSAASSPLTDKQFVVGTALYMSPEQCTPGRAVDSRSDIYSLGCVVFEMIAGVPPFRGATANATMSHHQTSDPPSLRTERPSSSLMLDAAVRRALAKVPADRFRTAGEFSATLDGLRTPSDDTPVRVEPIASTPWWRASRTRQIAKLTAIAAVVVAILAWGSAALARNGIGPWASRGPDTTRLVIFPFQRLPGSLEVPGSENLLRRGMERWRGLQLVEPFTVDGLIREHGAPETNDEAASLAQRIGAGRYVRARIDATPQGRVVIATIRDVARGELHHAQIELPTESSKLIAAYAALADTLLLRGAIDDAPDGMGIGSRSLPATQLMIRGKAALFDWNLTLAEALFAKAADLDSSSVRPLLWLAQVRAWAAQKPDDWLTAAKAAAADTAALTPRERQMAVGLVAMGNRDFPQACRAYRALLSVDPVSFPGWYGLGECHALDNFVVADSRSPSDWRYRTSYHQAVQAYMRAFELMPSTYRGFQRDAFARLRSLLYVSTRWIRPGVSAGPNPRRFYSRPSLDADSILFVPYPTGVTLAGINHPGLAEVGRAVIQLRSTFHRITRGWAAAYPNSPGAKEALAVSFEMQGDPVAQDLLRAAELLTRDSTERLRLAISRVYVRLKFALPDRIRELEAVRATADSLLVAVPGNTPDEARLLAPLAGIVGDCARASALLHRVAGLSGTSYGVPRVVIADGHALLAFTALGCDRPDSVLTLDQLGERLATLGLTQEQLAQVEYNLFGRIVHASFPADSSWVVRLAESGDYQLGAQRAMLVGFPDSARRMLAVSRDGRRVALAGEVTADGIYTEAKLWLALGDTLTALRMLESALSGARFYAPLNPNEPMINFVSTALLVRALVLRAELAASRRARGPWACAVAALWARADTSLQPTVRRMEGLCRDQAISPSRGRTQ